MKRKKKMGKEGNEQYERRYRVKRRGVIIYDEKRRRRMRNNLVPFPLLPFEFQ